MSVQNLVCRMMQNYPSLYRNRMIALKSLFESNYSSWKDGALVHLDLPATPREDYLPYRPEDLKQSAERSLLHVITAREQNAKAQFVHDNAELLSQEIGSRLDREYFVSFDGRRFEDIPEDVVPEWLDAAKELAHGIILHERIVNTPMDPRMLKQAELDQEAAKKLCRQFLERFKVIHPPSPYERAARVRALHREALALGMVLTEADGSAPNSNLF